MRSIAAKLWLSMVLLVALVLGLLGLTQAKAIKWSYYRLEAHRMVAEAEELAGLLASGASPQAVGERVAFLSQVFRATVLVVDTAGRVLHCRGMGPWRHFWEGAVISGEDVAAVLAGKTICREGEHPLFQGVRLLWVGVPIRSGSVVAGGVFIYAPLAPLEARVRGLEVTLVVALLGGVVLAGLLSLFVARHFSQRLVAIEKVAEAMAAGDYAARAIVTGQDEVARLAVSLNKLAAELEKRIAELKRMDAARRDFVAAVSHELRTPLSIIQSYTEAILDGMVTPEEMKLYLDTIREEVERLKRLTDELLDLRRLETGALKIQQEKLDLGEIARQVAARFQAAPEASKLHFHVEVSPVPLVLGDKDRLEQVIINLLDNAFRFTPAGGSVTLKIEPAPEGVALSVQDTGPGIPPEELPYIWEKFYRSDKARARTTGGSGLGLAIVKQIVELHGGRVEVQSRPGEGSTFKVILPAAK